MTKKDFQLIADLIKEGGEIGVFSERRKGQYANLTADRLEEENQRFNRYYFLKACGVVE